MIGLPKCFVALAALSAVSMWAGALYLEIGKSEANPEARALHALLVVQSTACHDPAKSTVEATAVHSRDGRIERTPLRVVPLKSAGTFAVLGDVPDGSLVDLTVENPQYKNYRPHVLIRNGAHGLEWTGVRRFFSVPPVESDYRSVLALD